MKNKKLNNLKLRTSTVGLRNKLRIIAIVCLLIFAGFSGVNATIRFKDPSGSTSGYLGDGSIITSNNGDTIKSWTAIGSNLEPAVWSLNGTGGIVEISSVSIEVDTTDAGCQLEFTDLENIEIIGHNTTIYAKDETGTTYEEMFVLDQCKNITIKGITFDGKKDLQETQGLGEQALIKIKSNCSDINFYDCKFINAIDCAFFIGTPHGMVNDSGLYDCVFNHIGEHIIYFSDKSASRFTMRDCEIYNWAETHRGYLFKGWNVSDSLFENIYAEANESGDLHTNGNGAYGFVVTTGSNNITFRNCYIKGGGDADEVNAFLMDYDTDADNIFIESCKVVDHGDLRFAIDGYVSVDKCVFNVNKLYPDLPDVMRDTTIYNSGTYMRFRKEHSLVSGCEFHNCGYIQLLSAGSGSVVEHCRFFNYSSLQLYPDSGGSNFIIDNNYFDRGITAGAGCVVPNLDSSGSQWTNNYFDNYGAGAAFIDLTIAENVTFAGNYFSSGVTNSLNWSDFRYCYGNIGGSGTGYVQNDGFPTENRTVGDINDGYRWFNITTNILSVYNGTAWVSTTLT